MNKRTRLYDKTDGRCAYCGCKLNELNYSVDHLQPKSKGGTNEEENLFLCCKSCNSRKKNRTLEELRFYLSLKFFNMPHFKYEQFLYLKSIIKDFEKLFFPSGQITFYYEYRENEKQC